MLIFKNKGFFKAKDRVKALLEILFRIKYICIEKIYENNRSWLIFKPPLSGSEWRKSERRFQPLSLNIKVTGGLFIL